jgi:hypothetical protein
MLYFPQFAEIRVLYEPGGPQLSFQPSLASASSPDAVEAKKCRCHEYKEEIHYESTIFYNDKDFQAHLDSHLKDFAPQREYIKDTEIFIKILKMDLKFKRPGNTK